MQKRRKFEGRTSFARTLVMAGEWRRNAGVSSCERASVHHHFSSLNASLGHRAVNEKGENSYGRCNTCVSTACRKPLYAKTVHSRSASAMILPLFDEARSRPVVLHG